MAMAFTKFEFEKKWTSHEDFPTVETDEEQVRADLQALPDELKSGLWELVDELGAATAAASIGAKDADDKETTVQAALTTLLTLLKTITQVKTAVDATGDNASLPTEKAVRDAISTLETNLKNYYSANDAAAKVGAKDTDENATTVQALLTQILTKLKVFQSVDSVVTSLEDSDAAIPTAKAVNNAIAKSGAVPGGGVSNYVLTKRSAADNDVGWKDITEVLNMGKDKKGLFLQVGEDGKLTFTTGVKFSNGPFLITDSQYIDFSKHGLKPGDEVNVVCIGGGGGGGAGLEEYNSKGDYYCDGGDGGKGGYGAVKNSSGELRWDGSPGGGAGGGYGGGGGGGGGGECYGGGGGGGGELAANTVVLTEATMIAYAEIGAAGKGGRLSYDDAGKRSHIAATAGGDTSFCGIVAKGGQPGGDGTSRLSGEGGVGGHAGGTGELKVYSDGSVRRSYGGGGGGGGWVLPTFSYRIGTDGADAPHDARQGGNGGTDGGKGGAVEGQNGQDSPNGFGHGCVLYWY
jgi:hypothetical protein